MRERFIKDGLDNFEAVNALELLLFYCLPRKDTNEIAHHLLTAFGSLAGVLEAKPEDLAKVEGVGQSAAVYLSLIGAVNRLYQESKAANVSIVKSIEDCYHILRPKFSGRRDERIYLICLDAKSKIICTKLISEGSVNTTAISIRKIMETSLSVNASGVILAHNHPSGLALPSAEDVYTTKRIAETLQNVDVIMYDHLIFGDDEFISMKQSGLFCPDGVV